MFLRVLLGFFFHEILTFLDQPANKSELLGELCVIHRKNKCYYSFVLQPSCGSALSSWIFALSHFGKKTHFLFSFYWYLLLFWHRCPRYFWVFSKHELFRQEISRGNLQFMADLYCWLFLLLYSLFCWQLPHLSVLNTGSQKANPSGDDGAETPDSCSITEEIIILNYLFDKSWFIFCLQQSPFHLMLANWIL